LDAPIGIDAMAAAEMRHDTRPLMALLAQLSIGRPTRLVARVKEEPD
jgi:hypothetical protein